MAGPAYEAEIEPGDILLQVGRTPAKDLGAVADALDSVKPGQVVSVTIVRVQRGRMGARLEPFNVALKVRQ